MAERITDIVDLGDIISAATKVNEDSYAVGLQPYEIRHLLSAIIAERKSINTSLRNMPYLGGMQRGKSIAGDVEKAVEVLKAVAERSGKIEDERDEMKQDIRAMRRVLGTEGGA